MIVRSTIDLAHNLGLTVVAEGVENADVLRAAAGDGLRRRAGHVHQPAGQRRGHPRADAGAESPGAPLGGGTPPPAPVSRRDPPVRRARPDSSWRRPGWSRTLLAVPDGGEHPGHPAAGDEPCAAGPRDPPPRGHRARPARHEQRARSRSAIRSRTTCVRRCAASTASARRLPRMPGRLLDEESRGHLDRIRNATRRMGQLIDDLLDALEGHARGDEARARRPERHRGADRRGSEAPRRRDAPSTSRSRRG